MKKLFFGFAIALFSISASAQVYSLFGPSNGIMKGATTTFQTSAAASSDITTLFSCGGSSTLFLNGAGGCTTPAAPTGANPTGTVGLATVNGSATTFMRSDAAPLLSQAITPSWSNVHTWTGNSPQININAPSGQSSTINFSANNSTVGTATIQQGPAGALNIVAATSNSIQLQSSGVSRLIVSPAGAIAMPSLATSSAITTGTVCWTTGTGNLTVDTTTTCLLSAKKFKQQIAPLDSGLNEVMKLRPVSYELKPEFNPNHLGRQVGFVADDVQKVDDRLVSHDPEDGSVRAMRYQQLTAVLVKAIQDQQKEIDFLKKHIREH